jgi:hypothetical protein
LKIVEPIAIVGSTNRGDAKTQADARAAAYQLGLALARKQLNILVYSDEPQFLEAEIVRGYLAAGSADRSIEVRYPEKQDKDGKPKPPPFNDHFNDARFAFFPDTSPDWEISYYTSFEHIGGMLVVQGGRSSLVAGVIALGYRTPLVVCSGFGGASTRLLSMVSDRSLLLAHEKAFLQKTPTANELEQWANRCVELLETQADRLADRRAKEALAQRSLKYRMNLHAIIALAAIVLSVALWILNWDNRLHLPPSAILAVLFICSALAGCTGAMLWVILPYLKGKPPADVPSIWSSGALGLLAGCIAAVLFFLGQEHGFPELRSYINGTDVDTTIEHIKAGFFAGLIPASMLSSLAAGITLDRALAALTTPKSKEAG